MTNSTIIRKFDESMIPEISERQMKIYTNDATRAFKFARRNGNSKALTEGICSQAKLADAVGFFKVYNTLETVLWLSMSDYTTVRRAVIAGKEVPEDTVNECRDLVFTAWKNLLSFDDSLHATVHDTEMLWLAMEKFVGTTPGQNTMKVFSRMVEREIGIRIARKESMTPEETQYKAATKALRRAKKAAEKRVKRADEEISVLKGLNLTGASADVKAFIADALQKAEEDSMKAAAKVEECDLNLSVYDERRAAIEANEGIDLAFWDADR